MNLITLNEVNLVACSDDDGCCSYPLCDPPIIDCRSVIFSGSVRGFRQSLGDGDGDDIHYHKVRSNYAGGGWIEYEKENILNVIVGHRQILYDSLPAITQSDPSLMTGKITSVYSGPMTVEAALQAISDKAKEAATDDDYNSTSICLSERIEDTGDPYIIGDFMRYRVGIPAGYEDRSTYKLQWEIVFITPEWEAWKGNIDTYNTQKKNHENWEQQDPGTRGAEPYVIPDPGDEPTKPVSVEKKDWNYTGTDFSDWFVMAPPPAPGKCVIANMLVVCYKSVRTGVKPTSTGPVYEVEET